MEKIQITFKRKKYFVPISIEKNILEFFGKKLDGRTNGLMYQAASCTRNYKLIIVKPQLRNPTISLEWNYSEIFNKKAGCLSEMIQYSSGEKTNPVM